MSLRTYESIEFGELDMHLSQHRAILRALKITSLDITLDALLIGEVSDREILVTSRLPSVRKLLVQLLLFIKK